ncbi:glycosyl transferase family 2 [Pyrobaculum neutrophilum V24Sta]|uniref:Glycosyl transferase family 2 n=1 Tax=Pyrobaculum neutrophilum (strain DSM 2338 / JCM 9278 / NBRC 100436 / V24Sta) TaxID=444157 RepID=B1YC96_PYRNV|nr:glycosyl transferase family 2 [Pyrobaculum neutrophilum V24Sta]
MSFRHDVCITVVLPVLNEAEALPRVVEELRAAGFSNILVVDGGSTDGSVEVAKRLGVRVVPQMGRGKGMAVRTALMYVDTPYVAFLDADYTYPAEDLKKLLPLLRHYDVVLGARRGEMPLVYKLGNGALGWLFRLLFGVDIRDPLTGMYAAKTEVLRDAALEARGFDLEVDLLAKALAAGARVAEVEIGYRRRVGKKKLRPWHGLSIALKSLSLAYRLNPTLSLSLLGALLLVPGVALGSWVAYRFFYQGVPHYMLGLLSLILLMLGALSVALLPLATAVLRLQAAVRRRDLRLPTDCLPPMPEPAPPAAPASAEGSEAETPLLHVGRGLVLSFMALLAVAAYYLGVGDAATANKLAEWAYYALAGAVVALLVDAAVVSRRGQRGSQT